MEDMEEMQGIDETQDIKARKTTCPHKVYRTKRTNMTNRAKKKQHIGQLGQRTNKTNPEKKKNRASWRIRISGGNTRNRRNRRNRGSSRRSIINGRSGRHATNGNDKHRRK